MSSPQTMREALIAELIGDLDTLITRTAELKAAIPVAADKAADKVAVSADALISKIEQSSNQLRADLARDAGAIAQTIQKVAGDAQAAAMVVDKAGRVSRSWRSLRASAVVFWVACWLAWLGFCGKCFWMNQLLNSIPERM